MALPPQALCACNGAPSPTRRRLLAQRCLLRQRHACHFCLLPHTTYVSGCCACRACHINGVPLFSSSCMPYRLPLPHAPSLTRRLLSSLPLLCFCLALTAPASSRSYVLSYNTAWRSILLRALACCITYNLMTCSFLTCVRMPLSAINVSPISVYGNTAFACAVFLHLHRALCA
jgi:hypothetical protein